MMLWLAVLNRLILFIRFYFTVPGSGLFLQVARGRMSPLLPRIRGANGLRDGRG
jgi:hypothetical protein